jgi:hypothetical protein
MAVPAASAAAVPAAGAIIIVTILVLTVFLILLVLLILLLAVLFAPAIIIGIAVHHGKRIEALPSGFAQIGFDDKHVVQDKPEQPRYLWRFAIVYSLRCT